VKEREARAHVKYLAKEVPRALHQSKARVERRDTKAPLGMIAEGKDGTFPCGVSTGFTRIPPWMKTRITTVSSWASFLCAGGGVRLRRYFLPALRLPVAYQLTIMGPERCKAIFA
jgi:hypothetical protein